MVLATIETPIFFFALVFAAIFYTILLLKDLIIVDRRSAYEVIALILSLLLLRDFYTGFADGVSGWAAFTALFLAWLIVLLLKSFTSKVEAGIKERGGSESGISSEGVNSIADSRTTGIKGPIFWFIFTIITELIIAGLFLPLDFIYQSILVFLLIILIFELVPEHLAGTLSKRKIFGTGVIIFALSIIVLLSARWGL